MRRIVAWGGTTLLLAASLAPGEAAGSEDLRARARALFGALPEEATSPGHPISEEKFALGRLLYYDKRLSKNHDVSCNRCHDLLRFGVDGEATSRGHRGQRGERNAPTVYNAAFQIAQFWDGRAADVEEQARAPVLDPVKMAMPDEAAVVAVLESIPGYAPHFAAAFPDARDPITYDNMAKAIGAFERRLVTPSRFDAYLGGDDAALTAEERRGLETFIATGCPTCHNGPLVGGGAYRKLGLSEPYPSEDTGRMRVTGRAEDEFVFKVPSLRNVAETAPYFHDGSVKTLDMAVRVMARFQLGRTLRGEEAASISAFLKALTGEPPEERIREPQLPPSGPDTPEPNPS